VAFSHHIACSVRRCATTWSRSAACGPNPPDDDPPAPQQPPAQLPKILPANSAPAANNDSSLQSSGVGMIFLLGGIGVGILALGLVSVGIVLVVMNGKKDKRRSSRKRRRILDEEE
jgi:hypothetical protein